MIVPGENNKEKPDPFTTVEPVKSSTNEFVEPFIKRFKATDDVDLDATPENQPASDDVLLAKSIQDYGGSSAGSAAEALNIASRTGYSSDYVSKNLPMVKGEIQAQDFDLDAFLKGTPKTASWVAKDPNHYPLVKDDLEKFKEIENMSALGQGWNRADLLAEKSELIGKRFNGTATDSDKTREAELDQELGRIDFASEGNTGFQNFRSAMGYTARQAGSSAGAAAVGAGIGAAGAALAPETMGMSMAASMKVGAVAASALTAYEMETNFAYDELTKLKDVNGQPAVDNDTAKLIARGIGAINASIETAGEIFVFKRLPYVNQMFEYAEGVFRKNATKLAVKALARESTKSALINSAKALAESGASEYAQEFSQSLVGAAGKRAAISIDGSIVDQNLGNDLAGAHEEGWQALMGSIGTFGLLHAGSNIQNHIQAVKNGEQNVRFYDAIARGTDSQAFKLLPDKWQEAVKSAIEGGGGEATYFQEDAWNKYWQEKGVNPREAASQVAGDGGKSYDQAFDTGGFIKVPTERVGRKLLFNNEHKELMMDATYDVAKETPRQALEAQEEIEAQIKNATTKKDVVEDAKLKALENQYLEMFKAANDPAAEQNAKIQARIHRTLGDQVGEEVIARSPLTVSRDLTASNGQTVYSQDNADDHHIDVVKGVHDPAFNPKSLPKQQTNASTGWNIDLSRKGVKKTVDAKTPSWAIASLPELLRIAKLDRSEKDIKGDPSVLNVHYLYAPIEHEGRIHAVSLMVKEIRDGKSSNSKFYLERVSDETRPAALTQAGSQSESTDIGTVKPSKIRLKDFHDLINDERKRFPLFQAKGATPNAQIRFGKDRQYFIDLFKGANFSSISHEMMHYWLEVMSDIYNHEQGSERNKKIFKDLLEFAGTSAESWASLPEDERTFYHEKIARGFEQYLAEGKAPSSDLRSAFQTFKSFMVWVYESLQQMVKDFGFSLTPEVKSAFDRMIATDEEIRRAQEEQNMTPLISDAAAAGMNEADAKKYSDLIQDAKAAAFDSMIPKVMSQLQKARSKAWQAEEKVVRAQVTADVDARPEQQLMKMFKDKQVKISRKSVVTGINKETADKLPRYVYAKDGIDYNSASSTLGFGSGWDMIQTIANTEDREVAIDKEVTRIMTERHGDEDVYLNGGLHDEALNAVHNEANSKRLQMEYEYLMKSRTRESKGLIKALSKRVLSVPLVKARAAKLIADMKVEDIKPYVFMRATRMNANEAMKLFTKGDFDGALEAKRKEILNHELYRAATNAQEEMDRAHALFNRFFQQDEKLAKTREMHIINAGRAILSNFGLGEDGATASEYLEQMKDYAPETYAYLISRIDATIADSDEYTKIPLSKFRDLHETMKGLWDLAKNEKTIQIDGKMVAVDHARDEMIAGLDLLPSSGADTSERTRTLDDDNASLFATTKARATRLSFKLDVMDAAAGDVFKKYLYTPVREATETYREKKGEVFKRLRDLYAKHKGVLGGKEIRAESIGYTFKNKNALLGAMIHTGNQSNFERLLMGRGWATMNEDGVMDTSNWDAFIDKCHQDGTLKREDYELLQGIWDTLASFKPDTQKAFKEINGYYFDEIKPRTVSTPFGDFEGGYVPATPDNTESVDADVRDAQAKVDGGFMSELPRKNDSFSKSRVNGYSTPLLLDLQLVTSHVDQVMKFTYITPRVKEVMKLVNNRKMQSAFKQYDPTFLKHVLIPFLNRATTQSTTIASDNKSLDQFLTFARNNFAFQVMFMNIPNVIQQAGNLIPAARRVGISSLMRSLQGVVMNNKKSTEFITQNSKFMANAFDRSAEKAAREYDGMIKNLNKFERGGEFLKSNVYIMQSAFQNVLNATVWGASFQKAIEEGKTHVQAVRIADDDVRQTQSSVHPEDASAIEVQGPIGKSLMMFFGFFNNMGNLYAAEWQKAGELSGASKVKERAAIMGNFFIYALVCKAIIDGMDGKLGDDDDDKESLAFWARYTFGASFDLIAPMFGIFGQTAQFGYKQFVNEGYNNSQIARAPLASSIEGTIKGVKALTSDKSSDKNKMKAYADLVELAPLMSFLPFARLGTPATAAMSSALRYSVGYAAAIGAAERPAGYLLDVNEGKVKSPENPLEAAGGLVTGRGQKR